MRHGSRQPEDEVERSHLCFQAGSRLSELEAGLDYKLSGNLLFLARPALLKVPSPPRKQWHQLVTKCSNT